MIPTGKMHIVLEDKQMKTQVLEKDGKKEFVVLAWDDYRKIRAMIEDYQDLKALRRAKEEAKGKKTTPFDKAVKSLKLRK